MTLSDGQIIEEAVRLVKEGLSVTLPVAGRSMLPFIIGGKESVILQRAGCLQEGDVVLAWVDDCRYVVHRIVRIDYDALTLMGDGNLVGTEHCKVGDVRALATHVVDAEGRPHPLYNRWRRQASRLWYWLRPVRSILLIIYRLL
ncbi:MAG: S24/S26 family peptidase [Prevotella sp.]|nr:S24/S26 family peptidase [Prevotella sp.]